MVGALQQLIDEILQISDADVSARLSLIDVEQSYRLEYNSDFRTFQNLYNSETLRIARSVFCEDCVKVFKQLHTRVQQMLEVTPRSALAHVIFQDHVRDFLTDGSSSKTILALYFMRAFTSIVHCQHTPGTCFNTPAGI